MCVLVQQKYELEYPKFSPKSTKYARLGYVLIAYASSSLEDSMRT